MTKQTPTIAFMVLTVLLAGGAIHNNLAGNILMGVSLTIIVTFMIIFALIYVSGSFFDDNR